MVSWTFDHGAKLRAKRESLGVSRAALVAMLNKRYGYKVTTSRIAEVERGRTEKGERKISPPSARLQDVLVRFFKDGVALKEAKTWAATGGRGRKPVRPTLINSEKVAGPHGEAVTVRFYDDHSIRVQVNGVGSMAISEAFLPVGQGKQDFVIVKLVPLRK